MELQRRPLPEDRHLWTMKEDKEAIGKESINTHLWIVMRAAELASNDPAAGKDISRWFFGGDSNAVLFRNAMKNAIWDADHDIQFAGPELGVLMREMPSSTPFYPQLLAAVTMSGYDKQPTYIKHFYDPKSGKSYLDGFSSAYREADASYRESQHFWDGPNYERAGYFLGIALHYFADVTQPLHSGNYGNLVNTLTTGDLPSFKHEIFENYANGLLTGIDFSRQPPAPRPYLNPQPGYYLDEAATYSKQYYPTIRGAVQDKVLGEDWKTAGFETLTVELLKQAAAYMAPYLVCWMREAQSKHPPEPLPPFAGPLSVATSPKDSNKTVYWSAVDVAGVSRWGIRQAAWELGSNRTVSTEPGTMVLVQVADYFKFPILSLTEGRMLKSNYLGVGKQPVFTEWEDFGIVWPDKDGDGLPVTSLAAAPRCQHTEIGMFAIAASQSADRPEGELLYRVWGKNQPLLAWTNLGGSDSATGGPLMAPTSKDGRALVGSPLAYAVDFQNDNNMDVFAVSHTGHLIRKSWHGTWAKWEDLGMTTMGGGYRIRPGSLAAVTKTISVFPRLDFLYIFAISNANHLLLKFFWAGSWIEHDLGLCDIDGGIDRGLAVTTGGTNSVDIFAITTKGTVVHSGYNEGSGFQNWSSYLFQEGR